MKNNKVQANAIAKAIVAIDSLGFGISEGITNVRDSLRDLMASRGYTMVAAGSSRTRALTKSDIQWKDYQSALSTEKGTQIERKQIITYRWWGSANKEIKGSHISDLEENATERIKQMVAEGYESGDLHAVVYDGDDEIEYTGWWESK